MKGSRNLPPPHPTPRFINKVTFYQILAGHHFNWFKILLISFIVSAV